MNWKTIRSLSGAQHKGFEELCAQLARSVVPDGYTLIRNGTPDGGVECYAPLPSGEEWGWQAKFVDAIEDSQWQQMDESVETALAKHPMLTRYHLCAPLDLPDARIDGRKSARDRWNDRVAKWTSWAAELGMSVEFVWWGSSELIDLLSLPANAGRMMFWFGVLGSFDQDWFEAHIARATKSAGPRYTHELHVELPISKKFEAFGRTAAMIARVRATGDELQERFKWIRTWADSDETPGLGDACLPLKQAVESLMGLLDGFAERPSGKQGLTRVCEVGKQALQACDQVEQTLDSIRQHWRSQLEAADDTAKKAHHARDEQLKNRRQTLRELEYQLRDALDVYTDEEAFAEAKVLLLIGEAGTGKTHLLCDLARQRVAEGRPTLLLLGQSFTTTDSPARQSAALLDLPNASLSDIVGCLEAAAQAANARALILIDALNEGTGRHIWSPHLAEFVETIKASPWLAVGLSIRTCYANEIVPESVRKEAAFVSHQGFDEVQYEAVRSFFLAHDLKFESAPVFSREFTNPLFLKTLCAGLKKSGYRTLPRGFHGITKVFNLYLDATEAELTKLLDYRAEQRLVLKALEAFVIASTKSGQQSLPSDEGQALVDRFLPGRDYSRSLFKGLLDNGLLMESRRYERSGTAHDVVCVAYERWADHLAVKAMLDEHFDPACPAKAFKLGGPLALYGKGFHMREGLKEALSIQLPERAGRELLSLMPYALREAGMADAFLHSVVWRDPESCTPALKPLMRFIENHDLAWNTDPWDVRITVATIPGNTLNMTAMDRWLKRTPMPDRDAVWSIAIYQAWERDHNICHLIDWAWRLERGTPLEEESAWLAALTLCWCFTSSHRFLRDRATKAAVNLLDDRLELTSRLVKHFADVDDLYVRERVLAVACGVALRSQEDRGVTALAEAVYETVFASGIPPAHILLRDYARCVIERAVHLGGQLTFDPEVAKPPYQSVWPTIPSEAEIKVLQEGLSHSDKRILNSVLHDDFSHYVIGTNHASSDWLSLRLGEPEWQSPSSRIEELIAELSNRQRMQWLGAERLRKKTSRVGELFKPLFLGHGPSTISETDLQTARLIDSKFSRLRDGLMKRLQDSLSLENWEQLCQLLAQREESRGDETPFFDLAIIQRYVIKRAYDLGWTTERFGDFDQREARLSGRDASKPERIGKKYQWIAYHEISALIADHFQYREDRWGSNRSKTYEGPWQDWFRDIDPTHTIRELPERVQGRVAWWETCRYDNWQSERTGKEWAMDASDFPDLSKLLLLTDKDGTKWVNAYGFYTWERKRLPSQGSDDIERRSVWTNLHASLVKRSEAQVLLDWMATIDIGQNWMPHQLPHDSTVFLAEHGWARASRFHEHPYYGHDGWHHHEGCPVRTFALPAEYLEEKGTFDCSMDESFTLLLPALGLTRELDLRWRGKGADFVTPAGELFAMDPSAHGGGRHCLLLREDLLRRYLDDNDLSLVWAFSGEKNHYGPRNTHEDFFGIRFSGAFELTADGVQDHHLRHYDQKAWATNGG